MEEQGKYEIQKKADMTHLIGRYFLGEKEYAYKVVRVELPPAHKNLCILYIREYTWYCNELSINYHTSTVKELDYDFDSKEINKEQLLQIIEKLI
ncbi:hypothetical protein FACS189451_04060 [Bacteroidia bacterium]|nr:hypothetical protein FACS189446_1860 [Bacteroidia bacterium]GHT61621.1 hypothetical protein FACS189451_04060 [Bacteroidia bacterium]